MTQAKLRYEDPKHQILLPTIADVLNDKSRWQSSYTSYIDNDLTKFLTEDKSQTENIEESYSKSEYFEQKWSVSASVSFLGLFRSGGASAEQIKREKHIKENATKIDISFQNIDTFNIVRGDWFDQNLIDRFASKLSSDMHTAIWGTNGQLELIPKTLLLGRGITYTIYADSQSIDYLYEHFQASADAGFFIGYFRVGGGGGGATTKENVTATRFADRIVFADRSKRAQVIGMLAKYYAASIPRPSTFDIKQSTGDLDSGRKAIEQVWSKPDSQFRKQTTINESDLKKLMKATAQ